MKLHEVISARRFFHLLRKEAYDLYRSAAVGAAAASAVVLVVYGISAYARNVSVQVGNTFATGTVHPLHVALFSIILFLVGPIMTSRVFRDLHDRIKSHDWLMFPASTFEKFTERWLVSGVLYAVGSLFGYFIITSLYAGIAELVLGRSIPIFNPFSRELWLMVAHYLVIHTLFILGAAYFRKNHFIKTILSVAIIGITLTVISAVLFRVVYGELFRELFIDGGASQFANIELGGDSYLGSLIGDRASRIAKTLATTAEIGYWVVFGPLCLTIAYLRVRETEVKDGV